MTLAAICLRLTICCAFALEAAAQIPPPPSTGHQESPAGVQTNTQQLNVEHDQKNSSIHSHYKIESSEHRKIITAEADIYCLNGFTLNKELDICEKLDERRADIGCPQGWDFKKGECTTTVVRPADRYCPEGYDDVHGRCQRFLEAPKQLICPPAYKRADIGCVQDVETNPIIACDKGELKHGLCVWHDIVKPLPSCAPDFELHGDTCARRKLLQVDRICPPAYLSVDGMCVKTTITTALNVCPDNSQMLGDICLRQTVVNPQFRCHDGLIIEATQKCTSETVVGPIQKCPSGSTTFGDVCMYEEKVPPLEVCPRGTKPSALHGCIGGKGKGPAPLSKSCPRGFQFYDKSTCIRKVTLEQEIVCPEGFSLEGTSCVATNFLPPKSLCPEGSIMSSEGQCLVNESFLPTKLCPEGQILDGDLCEERIVAEGIPTCSVGSFDPIQNACVLAEMTPSKIECPPFAKRISSGNAEVLCEEILKKEPKISCPPEFTMSDANPPMCLGRALVEGDLKCLPPYMDTGEKCAFKEVLPKMMGCADGSFLKGTSCVAPESQPPIVMCPEASTYEQDSQMCRKKLTTKPTPICPKGFLYDNLVRKCFKFVGHTTPQPPVKDGGEPPEKLLPLEIQPATTTTTKSRVKAKVNQPAAGKQQFIPIQTFTGAEALQQASQMEAAKLQNQANGAVPQQVFVPPVVNAH